VGCMSEVAISRERDSVQVEVATAGGTASAPLSFDAVLNRYQDEIYRYSIQLTRNLPDADDLYQETLLKAYRAFNRLDSDANYRAWLYRIATNTFLSHQRRKGRERPLDPEMDHQVSATVVDQAATLDARDLLNEVEEFIRNLPPKQRIALVLRKYHDLGYDQIAKTLDCSDDAARASVYEALRKLRACFGNRL
jgi:RNA polymerase sigma-70 factor, ECF subfamily